MVSSDSKAGRDGNKLNESEIDDNEVGGGEIDNEVRKKCQKMSKSKKSFKSKKAAGSSDFFIPGARLAFTKLRQALLKAPIFYHFNLKHHIWIETNALGYAIVVILSQLTLDDLGQWYPLAFFSYRMIPVETKYEMPNNGL